MIDNFVKSAAWCSLSCTSLHAEVAEERRGLSICAACNTIGVGPYRRQKTTGVGGGGGAAGQGERAAGARRAAGLRLLKDVIVQFFQRSAAGKS